MTHALVRSHYSASLLSALIALSSVTDAQENSEFLQLSIGENLSAVSQTNGILIDTRWSPAFAMLYRSGNFFIDSENGIGIALFSERPVHIGAMLDYQYGRRAHADSRYEGMGNVDGAIAPAAFIEWEPIPNALDFYLNASKAVSGSTGWLYKMEFSGGLPITSNKNIYVDIAANASDSRYAQAYYGVNSAQSAASNYSLYSPQGGWLTLNYVLGYEYRLSSKLSIDAQIGQLRYIGKTEKSPLVANNLQLTAGIFTTYQY